VYSIDLLQSVHPSIHHKAANATDSKYLCLLQSSGYPIIEKDVLAVRIDNEVYSLVNTCYLYNDSSVQELESS
jgi:hypothetical protein